MMTDDQIKAIIEKYKAITPDDVFYKLAGNRIVIGEEIDDGNHMFYVIRDLTTNELTVELAWNQPITAFVKNALEFKN